MKICFFLRQDMLYNPAASTGFFLNTLRYRMNKKKLLASSDVPIDEMNNLSLSGAPTSEGEKNDLLIFFRSCNLRTEMSELIKTMKRTVDFRREVMRDVNTQIMQSFPFYFSEPKLVCSTCVIYDCLY